MKQPVLVVMAAGMGSRYGGDDGSVNKQETIVIKEAIREDFLSTVGKRLEK